MRLGVCYFPEQWDRSYWKRDAARMADLGLSVVRLGEFAWSAIEPEPGVFRWDWYDEAIGILTDAGLTMILGTPTATPPKWLIEMHPDILPFGRDGKPRGFGSRRHYCFSSPSYRRESARIVEALLERYGTHDAVEGWQTDNEYGCHDTVRSYSPAAANAFRSWLAERYGDIAALNAAWGTVFWSQTYRSFDEVDLPNLTVTEPTPAHVMDFYRFSSDQVISYNKMQVDIIRRLSPGRSIYHNAMGHFTDFDHFALGFDVDVIAWDSYPLGFLDVGPYRDEDKVRFMRQGHPDFAGFHHDLYRACGRGRVAVMEQQPGPVNWAHHNPAPKPGMVKLWTLEAAAHGAELVSYFRWRQAPFAQEQMHAGLLRRDDAPAAAFEEVEASKAEIGELGRRTGPSALKVALIFDYETQWMSEIQPQGAGWTYQQLVLDWYGAARRLGADVDVKQPGEPLEGYDAVLVPCLMHVSEAALAAFSACTAPTVLGPRSGSKTVDFQLPQNLAPGPLQALINVTFAHSESFPESVVVQGQYKEQPFTGSVWLDHGDHQITGEPAPLLYREDNRVLFTTVPDPAFLRQVLSDLVAERGIAVTDQGEAVRWRSHGPGRVQLDYDAVTVS
ncbi:MAG: beta-galactosidase [Pseudomonadota bacterium]